MEKDLLLAQTAARVLQGKRKKYQNINNNAKNLNGTRKSVQACTQNQHQKHQQNHLLEKLDKEIKNQQDKLNLHHQATLPIRHRNIIDRALIRMSIAKFLTFGSEAQVVLVQRYISEMDTHIYLRFSLYYRTAQIQTDRVSSAQYCKHSGRQEL